MKINANSIRVGNILEHNSRLWQVAKIQHTQPGKGGAYIQVEMKDIKTGTKLNERFRSEENVEKARLDQTDYQYLYDEGENVAVMNKSNFEQISVSKNIFGDAKQFLDDGMDLVIESYEGEAINGFLPENITLTVKETEAVVKGQTAASSYKPAITDNDVRVMVPPFINQGDKIVIKSIDGTYVGRENN